MDIVTDWQANAGMYNQEEHQKTQIYLHHTVGGSSRSSFEFWQSKANKVSTAFLVERDGTVYQVWEPKYWAYHLGLKTANNLKANKQSIGIELASEGALRAGFELNKIRQQHSLHDKFSNEFLYAFDIDPDPARQPQDWFNRAKNLYSIEYDTLFYTQMVNTWRGFDYFDQYDEMQVQAVTELVKNLCETFSIPKQLIGPNYNRFEPSLVDTFSGVLTHCNVRSDKTDIHLNFPWNRLESSIKD